MARPAVLFYCQHSVGMGHLMRSVALVRALAGEFGVTFVSGGPLPRGLQLPEGVRVVQLPPVGMDANGQLVSRDARRSLERALAERRHRLMQAFAATAPRAIVVELFPFGRRKFLSELAPMLDAARSSAQSPVVVSSVRDILVGRQDRQAEHDVKASALLARYFDGVLVHSDPAFARLEESFGDGRPLPVPVHYTGFVHDAGPLTATAKLRPGSIVVSAGGGLVGGPLLRSALAAHALVPADVRLPLTLLAGPFLPESEWRELQQLAHGRRHVTVRRSVPHLALELSQAAASISQGGYNTVMDLLRARVPALVVPYGGAAEDEQSRRAARLEGLGALRVLTPEQATAQALAQAMAVLPRFVPATLALNTHGAERTTEVLRALCGLGLRRPAGTGLLERAG